MPYNPPSLISSSTSKLKKTAASFGLFLAENTWGRLHLVLFQIAPQVVPLSLSAWFVAKQVTTFFFVGAGIVRFPSSPRRILSSQGSAVDPVELSVSLADKTKPHTPSCDCLLLLHQVIDKVVFIS